MVSRALCESRAHFLIFLQIAVKKYKRKKLYKAKKILEFFLKKRHFFTQILPFFGRKSNFF